MNRNVRRSVWKKARVVDLPYMPFDANDETERSIINHVANRIIQIAANERRIMQDSEEWSKNTHFDRSECVVAIDVSSMGNAECSYLDNVAVLTRIHPFILINCSVDEAMLRQLRLQKTLCDQGYILPVFRRIAPIDSWFSARRYGPEATELLQGKVQSANLDCLKGLGERYSFGELERRFPGLVKDAGKLKYKLDMCWLGVDSENMCNALNELFNRESPRIKLEKLCEKHNIDRSEVERYIDKSMLFFRDEKDSVVFRLQRKLILPEVQRALLAQFEEEMVRRDVIDTRSTDYCNFTGRFLEHHSVGKLFDARDTFSLKLLSYIRLCVEPKDVDAIVVLDNGKEFRLCELLARVRPEIKVVKVMNYYGLPIVCPFDRLSRKNRVLVIADVVNTGNFYRATLAMLEYIGVEIVASFAFVINNKVSSIDLLKGIRNGNRVDFHYYIQKALGDVKELTRAEHERRFGQACEEAFLLFWNFAGANAEIELGNFIGYPLGDERAGEVMRSLQVRRMAFGRRAKDSGTLTNALQHFINTVLDDNTCDYIVVSSDISAHFVRELVKDAIREVQVIKVPEDLETGAKALVLVGSMSCGRRLIETVQRARRAVGKAGSVIAMTVVQERNVVSEAEAEYRTCLRNLEEEEVDLYCFYAGNLPFYLVHAGRSFLWKAMALEGEGVETSTNW